MSRASATKVVQVWGGPQDGASVSLRAQDVDAGKVVFRFPKDETGDEDRAFEFVIFEKDGKHFLDWAHNHEVPVKSSHKPLK